VSTFLALQEQPSICCTPFACVAVAVRTIALDLDTAGVLFSWFVSDYSFSSSKKGKMSFAYLHI
jgi:hypothetical protein